MKNIAILASGYGSNALNIINFFSNSEDIKTALVLSNKADAPVIEKAREKGVDTFVFSATQFKESEDVLHILEKYKIDYIILAGFLLLLPPIMVKKYEGKILNIHPSLLPKYGGKGMYGMNVHKAVVDAKDNISGITIHHVNEKFDDGDIIFQATIKVTENDTPDDVSKKVRELEIKYFPSVINDFINNSI